MGLRLHSRIQHIFVGTAFVLACRGADLSTGIPPRDLGDSRAEVYQAILDTLFAARRPGVILIQDSSVKFWSSRSDVLPGTQADFPEELLTQLNTLSVSVRPLGGLGVPAEWRRVPLAQIMGLFHTNPDVGWSNFHARYPDSQGWLGVTPIAMSQDGKRAIVYCEWHCGSLCGVGSLASIARDEHGRWRVRRLRNYWISEPEGPMSVLVVRQLIVRVCEPEFAGNT